MAPPARLSLVIAEEREGKHVCLVQNFPADLAKRRRQNNVTRIINNILRAYETCDTFSEENKRPTAWQLDAEQHGDRDTADLQKEKNCV